MENVEKRIAQQEPKEGADFGDVTQENPSPKEEGFFQEITEEERI